MVLQDISVNTCNRDNTSGDVHKPRKRRHVAVELDFGDSESVCKFVLIFTGDY